MSGETSRFTWFRAYTWAEVMAFGGPTWRPVEAEPFSRMYDFDDECTAIEAARSASTDGKIRVVKVEATHTVIHEEPATAILPNST